MEKNTITINGQEYKVPAINFKAIMELENLGVDFMSVQNKSFGFMCSLVAFTTKTDLDSAADAIEAHIANGGSLEDFTPLFNAVVKSDFFQNLTKKRKK